MTDDSIAEGNENAAVTVASITSGNAAIGSASTASVAFGDDETLNVSITALTNAAEPGGNGSFTVSQSAVSATDTVIAVSYGGTAQLNADFTAAGSLTIPAGETVISVPVQVINDGNTEGPETVTVSLSSVTSGLATIGSPASANVTITDDASVSVSLSAVSPGREASSDGSFTVTQSAVSATDTVVAVTYAGAAQLNTDYSAPASVTIPAGQTSVTAALDVTNDSIIEGPESLEVSLSGITSGLAAVGSPATRSTQITDNDAVSVVLSAISPGAEPASNASFTISQSDVSPVDTVIRLSYGGDAKRGLDYTAPVSVTISAGEVAVVVPVTIVDDVSVEGPETVKVSLSSVTSGLAQLGSALSAKTLIADNDTSDVAAVQSAFERQTHNYMVRRLELLSVHEPTLHRLITRSKSDFEGGANGFTVTGDKTRIEGEFALDARSVTRALDGPVSIVPVSDGMSRSGQARDGLNVWAEGQFGIYDDSRLTRSLHGDFFIGYAGADFRFDDRLLAGVMTEVDWIDEDAKGSGDSVSGKGWMVGPYVSAQPIENVFVDVRAMWGRSDNLAIQDILGARYRGSFETNRWLVDGRVAGQYNHNNFTVTPEVSFLYLHEQQDDYVVESGAVGVAVSGQDVSLGRLGTGLTLAYHGAVDDVELAPFVSGRLLWNFDKPTLIESDGSQRSIDDLQVQFSGGLTLRKGNSQLSLEGSYDGLGVEGLDSFTGKALFALQF